MIVSLVKPVAYLSLSYVYSNCCASLVDSITDRAGRTTYFQYDDLKRLIESENPENGITAYGYDTNSNLTSFTDPEIHTTSFEYDLDNRLVKKTYHDTTYVEWAYNSVGLVETYTNARGTTMTYSYDANDNLTGVNYSDGTPNVSYDYDDFDRIEEMVDGIGTWGYGYDANSRLTSVDGPWNEDTITYDYDDLGRRTSMTPQRGTALTYVHDTLNRLTEIQRGTVATTYTYAYSGVNQLVQSLTRPNGSVTSYQYDLLNRLEEISNKTSTDAIINQFAFTYNNEDLRGSETITNGPAMPTLTEEDTTYSYNEVNQLLSTTNPNQTFLYDDDGNLIQGYTPEGYLFSATYDAENRLTAFEYTDDGGIDQRTEYKYSGDGFLAEVWKYEGTLPPDRINIVRDGFLAIQDRDGNNSVLREYTWGLNLGGGISGLINLEQNGQNYAYLYDGKGNVIAVLDNSEAVVATYRYDPFGILLAQTGSLTQPFGFSTKRYDPQTGLVYYGHRYYSPAIGRWTTRDPLGEVGGLNLYAFVGNNPVNWVDPWGLRIRVPIDIDAMIKHHQEVQSALDFLPNCLLEMFYPTTPEGIASALEDQVMGMVCPLNITSPKTPTQKIIQHTSKKDLIAAAKEAKTGVQYLGQHLKEVREAVRALGKRIRQINRALGNPNLTPEQYKALLEELATASRHLDAAKKAIQGIYKLHE